jgi:hypothetical protein
MTYPLPAMQTDSLEYEVLYDAAVKTAHLGGLTCEIGVRSGGSSELILKGSMNFRPARPHIALDPWGDLPYAMRSVVERRGYDDVMKRSAMKGLYEFAEVNTCDVLVLPWKDTDFFARCATGVPLYIEKFPGQELWNSYTLVHFDGPHESEFLVPEIAFFLGRTPVDGMWVFDDVKDYPHDAEIEPIVLANGFERVDSPLDIHRPEPRKRSYVRRTTWG